MSLFCKTVYLLSYCNECTDPDNRGLFFSSQQNLLSQIIFHFLYLHILKQEKYKNQNKIQLKSVKVKVP